MSYYDDFEIENGVLLNYNGDEEQEVEIPEGVVTIAENAMASHPEIFSVTFPDSLRRIEADAFQACYSMPRVYFPRGVEYIDPRAFDECAGIYAFDVDKYNFHYTSKDGVLYDKNKMTLIQYPKSKSGNFTVPRGVIKIGEAAFFECEGLTDIKFNEGLTELGNGSFCACSGLEYVVLPKSLLYIRKEALSSGSLHDITIYERVMEIDDMAFFDVDEILIHGKAGSYVERYAKENDIPFMAFK